MMTWQLYTTAAVGIVVGYLIRSAVVVVADYLDHRPVTTLQPVAAGGEPPEYPAQPALIRSKHCPEGYSAAQVLGYHDAGARRVEPSYPGGLDAWDVRHQVARSAA